MLFCRLLIFFSKSAFSKISFRQTIRVSNSLDPDKAGHYVGPDLVPNCLKKLSTDNTRRQRVQKSQIGISIYFSVLEECFYHTNISSESSLFVSVFILWISHQEWIREHVRTLITHKFIHMYLEFTPLTFVTHADC